MALDPMRSLVDVFPGMACVHRNGMIVHANRAFATRLGFADASELRAILVDTLVCSADRTAFLGRANCLSADQPGMPAISVGWLDRSGGVVKMMTSAARIPFEGNPAIIE